MTSTGGVSPGTGRSAEQGTTGQDETAQDQTAQDQTRQDSTGQDHFGQDSTGQDSTGLGQTRQDSAGKDTVSREAVDRPDPAVHSSLSEDGQAGPSGQGVLSERSSATGQAGPPEQVGQSERSGTTGQMGPSGQVGPSERSASRRLGPSGTRDGNERRTFTPDFLTELFRNPLDPGYADAAARRARGEGPSRPVRRVLSAVNAVTVAALGFLLVVAYQQTMADEPSRSRAHDTLVDQVQSRRSDAVALQERADGLRSEVAALRERQLGGAAVARLRDLEAATGLAPVRGGGARVTLKDGPTSIDPLTGERKTEAQVKDSDLQLAANALWAAGAEAIAINGQRLTATSTIRQAGEAILVDFRPVASPYEVVAIGPGGLAGDFRQGYAGRFFRELVSRYAMSFDAAPAEDVTLGAATELNLRVAQPAPLPTPSSSSPSPSEGGR